jgi:hypothetical protein
MLSIFQQRDAVGVGHPDIEQHQVGAQAMAHGAGLGGVFRQFDLMALVIEDFRQQVAYAQFVVDHQYVCHEPDLADYPLLVW